MRGGVLSQPSIFLKGNPPWLHLYLTWVTSALLFGYEARNFRNINAGSQRAPIIFTVRLYLFSQFCADLPLSLGKMTGEVGVEGAGRGSFTIHGFPLQVLR